VVVVREWGESYFVIKTVHGAAAGYGVEVGEAIVTVGGTSVRWKGLSELTMLLRNAPRPVAVEFAPVMTPTQRVGFDQARTDRELR